MANVSPTQDKKQAKGAAYAVPWPIRLRSYSYVGIFVLLVQWTAHYFAASKLPGMYLFTPHIIFAMVVWALVAYTLSVIMPYRVLRRGVAIVHIALYSVLYLTDMHMLNAYQTPFTDSMAFPLLATNPGEIEAFLSSSTGRLGTYARYLIYLAAIGVISGVAPTVIKYLGRIRCTRCKKRTPGRWPRLLLPGALVLLIGVGFVRHAAPILKDYRNNWLWYNSMTLPDRAFFSYKMARKELFWSYSNNVPTPTPARAYNIKTEEEQGSYNLVLVIADRIYPALMHCYGYEMPTTPVIDTLSSLGLLHVETNLRGAPNAASEEAIRNMLSSATDKSAYLASPTLTTLLAQAGYTTYWLSNKPKAEPWQQGVPRPETECDSVLYTHLRGSAEEWWASPLYDEAVLNHLASCTEPPLQGAPLLQYVHLCGGRESIWQRVPNRLQKFSAIDFNDRSGMQDNLGQYCNIIYYYDYLVGKILRRYAHTPALILFIGSTGAQYNPHPYTGENIPEDQLNQIPFLWYISPELQRLRPALYRRFLELKQVEVWQADDLTNRLLSLLGLSYRPTPATQ